MAPPQAPSARRRRRIAIGIFGIILTVFVVAFVARARSFMTLRWSPSTPPLVQPTSTVSPRPMTPTPPQMTNDNTDTVSSPKVTAASTRTTREASTAGGIVWTARSLYLPVTDEAIAGFQRYEDKQRQRDPTLLESWRAFPEGACLQQVPECEFFKAIKLNLLFAKCCAEHTKMQAAFNYTMDVAEAYQLDLFLDSGTLLSAMRDGEMTLVPWETDIDLGIVGVDPGIVAEPFAKFAQDLRSKKSTRRKHHFAACLTKVSKNVSRNGRCRDAHYVYYANSADAALHDTSRVEIWPFWPEPGVLVHPTRKKLSVPPSLVLPLRRCRFWGRQCWCPGDSVGYLNHEYGQDGSWRYPKTIHWGTDNVKVVKKA